MITLEAFWDVFNETRDTMEQLEERIDHMSNDIERLRKELDSANERIGELENY